MLNMSRQIAAISKESWELYEMQAEFCKALSHPTRHAIIQELKETEHNVTQLAQLIGVSQSNLSQHLSVLKDAGIVFAKRTGVNVTYYIADPTILKACSIIHKALQDRITKQKETLASLTILASEDED
jgi:DNA-binding transcriptional ArsR family regulator